MKRCIGLVILLGLAGQAQAQSYTYVAPGFTQELLGTAPVFLGGVSFAPDGDPWVSECGRLSTGRLFRFDLQTRYNRVAPYDIHPYTEYSPNSGCGLVRHPDGYLYTTTVPGTLSAPLPNGIVQINAETGQRTGRVLGGNAVGNTLGITIDPLTGHLVYAGYECRSPTAGNVGPTCYIYDLDPSVGGTPRVYAAISASQVLYVDGMEFDPTGNYLFMATRAPANRLTILDRSGRLVQNVPLQPLLPGTTASPGPDGVAFHEDGFVVTNNLDGTITRYDFPNGDYAQPPVQSLFASGGFRGDLSQVGADTCLYVTQEDTRYADGLTTTNDSLVRFCHGFIPPVGVRPGCHTNADCGGSTPVCRLNGQCGQCSASDTSRCTGATSVCDVLTGTCRGCASGTPAGTSCDDRNLCTTGDQCSATGACGGAPVPVDDGNPCTVDACDPVRGITHAADVGAGCSDANVCTSGDRCNAAGQCAGSPVAIDDGNPCTVDACDPAYGVTHTAAVGAACNDGNACTTGDRCDAAAACGGTAVAVDDGNPCTADACDPVRGVSHTVLVGTACSDGNACTAGDTCQIDGRCGGAVVSVEDGNPCTVDACDPVSGVSHVAAVGAACNDANACTTGDQCTIFGACAGAAVAVDDGNACTADACDPATGPSHTVTVGASCNDGDACTAGDQCQLDGRCGGAAVQQDDDNPCTADACDPVLGVSHTPSPGTSCNDGNACTSGDLCDIAGHCGGAAIDVDDGNACTADVCDPATGPSHTVTTGAACDDGDTCTTGDHCQADGRCGGAALGLEGNVCAALDLVITASLDATCGNADDQDLQTVPVGTPVYYCYRVTNRSDVAISGVSVSDSLENSTVLTSGSTTLAPGQSATFISAVTHPAGRATDLGQAHGLDPSGVPVVSNPDSAAVQVVSPGIRLDVTVSTTGTCPGVDALTVTAGTNVVYCYQVTNSGDTALDHVVLTLGDGQTVALDSLAPGGSTSYGSQSAPANTSYAETAGVVGTDPFGAPVTSSDSAVVNVLRPDLSITKTAATQVDLTQTQALTYTLSVTNLGQGIAYGATVSDPLPAGLQFVSAASSVGTCGFAGGVVTCALGDLGASAGATITIDTAIVGAPPFSVTNTATTGATNQETVLSNNTSSATTSVSRTVTGPSGATRTIGYYSTHPQAVAACLTRNGNFIDLGWLPLRNERYDNEIDAAWAGNGADRDGRIETAMSLAMGILKANVAKWSNGQKRSALEKARMQASQQVLAAICNSATATPPFSLGAAVQTLAGTNVQAILSLSAQTDAFNNSGDSIPLGADYGPADAQYPWDDPSDPND
ncbi:MAG TPA: DUF11 domain-containing protein [Polyangia bacterium]|jgi:uncharacterized repeat protein (TIGR01451 family)|nr:DUF11 domain-containing protein [Polyangia bacterium]